MPGAVGNDFQTTLAGVGYRVPVGTEAAVAVKVARRRLEAASVDALLGFPESRYRYKPRITQNSAHGRVGTHQMIVRLINTLPSYCASWDVILSVVFGIAGPVRASAVITNVRGQCQQRTWLDGLRQRGKGIWNRTSLVFDWQHPAHSDRACPSAGGASVPASCGTNVHRAGI